MKFELFDTVTIASHWLSALVNYDWTGLSESECEQLKDYLKDKPHNLIVEYGESGCFARDAVTGLLADCVEVELYCEIEKPLTIKEL